MGNEVNTNYMPLLIGYDDGNGKETAVLSVFERALDGSYILKKVFYGKDASTEYDRLIGRGEET